MDKSPMVFARADSFEYHNGWALDCSPQGMCFESHIPLCPGDRIVIKMVNYCMIMAAQVETCRQTANTPRACFMIQVRYDEHIFA